MDREAIPSENDHALARRPDARKPDRCGRARLSPSLTPQALQATWQCRETWGIAVSNRRSGLRQLPLLLLLLGLTQQPLDALVHHASAGACPFLPRHVCLSVPVPHALRMPFGSLSPYLFGGLCEAGLGPAGRRARCRQQGRAARWRARLGMGHAMGDDERERDGNKPNMHDDNHGQIGFVGYPVNHPEMKADQSGELPKMVAETS